MLNASVAWLAREIPLGEFLIQDVLLAAGLIAVLGLFIGMKSELRTQARRHKQAMEKLGERLAVSQVVAVESRENERAIAVHGGPPASYLSGPSFNVAAPAFAPPARAGFNLQHRTQAIRLLRRGEDVAHVSAALGVPRCEVELLIRVQELAAKRVRANSR